MISGLSLPILAIALPLLHGSQALVSEDNLRIVAEYDDAKQSEVLSTSKTLRGSPPLSLKEIYTHWYIHDAGFQDKVNATPNIQERIFLNLSPSDSEEYLRSADFRATFNAIPNIRERITLNLSGIDMKQYMINSDSRNFVDRLVADPAKQIWSDVESFYVHGPVADLAPLARLKNVKHLSLIGTGIVDLTPLSGLKTLTDLDISQNPLLQDLTPLSGLKTLTELHISHNPVQDLTPLSGLSNLTHLDANYTHVQLLTPLEGLSNLTHLSLAGLPQPVDVTPLTRLTRLWHLNLDNTPVRNFGSLAGLRYIEFMDLRQAVVDLDAHH